MDDEARRHWALIKTPPGIEWSGRARYAAAMFFYQRGEMDAQTLEIYRILSRLDAEDPVCVLRSHHIGAEWILRMEAEPDRQ